MSYRETASIFRIISSAVVTESTPDPEVNILFYLRGKKKLYHFVCLRNQSKYESENFAVSFAFM